MIKPRILYVCGREPEYVRNLLVLRALKRKFSVREVTDHKPGSLLLRNLRLLPHVAAALRAPCDLVFVGFYGYLLMLFLRPLVRVPILFDAFVSNWDSLCFDRQRFAPYSAPGRFAYWLDKTTCRSADHCLLDTAAHTDFFVDTFGLPRAQFSTYYVGFDEEVFYPRSGVRVGGPFRVFYYGSYLPLQGVQYIVEAAKLLKDEPDIEFHIIGEGITYSSVRKSAASMGVDRLFFQAAVPYVELPAAIAQASVCLGGPFGATSKARRVIAGKTFQFLAMAKPTIVGDSPANREVFTHGEDVLMCRMADARALADAILTFKQDALLREHVAQRGYEHCQMQFSLDRQMQSLEHIVSGLL